MVRGVRCQQRECIHPGKTEAFPYAAFPLGSFWEGAPGHLSGCRYSAREATQQLAPGALACDDSMLLE